MLCTLVLFGLSACIETAEVKTYKISADQSVITKFFFNISAENKTATKQNDHDTQECGHFRGIDDATLFAFTLQDADGQYANGQKVLLNTAAPTKMYNLSTVLPKGSIPDTTGGSRMVELEVPTGTNAMIFYAKAYREPMDEKLDIDEQYGKLEYVAPESVDGRTTDLTAIGCKAAARLNDSNRDQYAVMENTILAVLNHLLRVGYNGNDPWDISHPSYKYGNYDMTKLTKTHWYDYAQCSTHGGNQGKSFLNGDGETTDDASQIETILGNTYVALTTIGDLEYRSGAGAGVERMIADLYEVLKAAQTSGAKDNRERVAMVVVDKLIENILLFFEPNNQNELVWKDTETVLYFLRTSYNINTNPGNIDLGNNRISTFPRHFHIPFGGATIILDPDNHEVYKQFIYNDDKINIGKVFWGDASKIFYISVNDFTYTPELCYYCNTPIHTTTETSIPVASMPSSVAKWPVFDGNWNSAVWTKNSIVEADTRGIALANAVQYGVALLNSQVIVNTNQLKDNNAAINSTPTKPEDDKTIILGPASRITWTGIIVAGQPDKVGWQYLPMPEYTHDGKTYPATTFNKMVYDKVNYVTDDEEGYALPYTAGDGSEHNYTIVFDSYNPNWETQGQNIVYVCLEFRNDTGMDFWGNANLVRNGGTFYIAAAMNPAAATWPTDLWTDPHTSYNMMPPYDAAGNTIQQPRVFMQDYVTVARFYINEDSLKHAFVTVPDLRSARLSLGLAIDLTWQSGASFDIPLGN